jgi:predicted Zn-dependent peptidase
MAQLARCFIPLLLAGFWSNSASAQTKIPPIKFSDTRLSNGLRVIIAEDHYAPVFAIAVSYEVGSKDERPGRTGFAHLFEHMMFKGSENVGAGEHFFLIFNYGGNMNGTTSTDRTLYYEVLPKNQLDLGLFLESDRMRSLAVTKDNLDNQRQAVQEERRQGLDNQPYGKSGERFNEMAYDNFAYKHSVIGSMDDLNAASVQDVQDFFRTYYAPNNAVIALVGDLNTKETLAKMEKYFGNIPRQTSPKHVDLAEPEMHAERREKMDDKLSLPYSAAARAPGCIKPWSKKKKCAPESAPAAGRAWGRVCCRLPAPFARGRPRSKPRP